MKHDIVCEEGKSFDYFHSIFKIADIKKDIIFFSRPHFAECKSEDGKNINLSSFNSEILSHSGENIKLKSLLIFVPRQI
jgi:hypothetical protein